MRRERNKVGDGFDPDRFALCLHFLVVKSETWMVVTKPVAGGTMVVLAMDDLFRAL